MTDKSDSGGPAFPNLQPVIGGGAGGSAHQQLVGRAGMSLRDWFAGQALPSLLSSYPSWPQQDIVRGAYRFADLMISERIK